MDVKMSMELLMSRAPESELLTDTLEIETLVRRTLAGDPAGFEGIVRKFERRVMTLSLRLLGDVHTAEDATQETFLRAFKYLHRLDLQKPMSHWLTQIAVNVCRDMARKRDRLRNTFPDTPDAEVIDREPQDQSPDPYDGLTAEEQRRTLREALNLLPEKERMALLLRDVEGLSTAEVADILGSSETTVRSQICRGRLRLKEVLDRTPGGKR